MIDDQTEINLQISRKLNQLRDDPNKKELIVISGAPGTGKTVLGLHILYTYCKIFKSGGKKDGKCILSLPRSRTLAQVIEGESGIAPVYLDKVPRGLDVCVADEAHRIEKLDQVMTELFRKSKIVVVLQDDRQRIRLTEEGSRDHFLQFAKRYHLEVSDFCLYSHDIAQIHLLNCMYGSYFIDGIRAGQPILICGIPSPFVSGILDPVEFSMIFAVALPFAAPRTGIACKHSVFRCGIKLFLPADIRK